MPTLKQISFTSAFICALLSTAIAQESTSPQGSSLTITAAAIAGERVRIAAPASVVQMHVEVYAAGGEKLFDQEIRGGNVFDWHLQDGQGQRLAAGNYVCVVTAKSVSGKLTQKLGTVRVEETSVSVQPTQSLSAAQSQAIGPVEENSSWMLTGKDEPQTPTVIAHDGTDGQMIRGRGALTFRIGNFFTGLDQEQMRLTEDGNLGIGTSAPKTTLDVAGTIRAQRYLISKPKAVGKGLSAQDSLTANVTEPDEALITGTGTQDRIAKWIDNSATLGDSSITEIGGNVGIGTTSPGSRLVVSSNTSTLPPASGVARFADADGVQTAVFADSFGTNPIFNVRRANGTAAAPSAVQANQLLGVIGASGYGASAYVGTRARVGFFASENWTNTANGSYLTFNTTANGAATAGGTERLRIDNAGKVGIGTPSPQELLNVNGNIRWGGTTTNFVRSGQDAGGLFLEQQGNSAATSAIRLQSSTSGNATDYSQFFIDPNNGFSFMTIGTANGNVGIGISTPTYKLHVVGDTSSGVFGSSNVGYGVNGKSTLGTGVFGESTSSIGVFGSSTSNYGVYGSGNVGVVANSNIDLGTAVAANIPQSGTGNLVEGYRGPDRKFHIDNAGTYVAGSDFAEALPALGDRDSYEPGDVLVVSAKTPGKVEKASRAYDPRVAGIYSTRPGMLGADKNGTSRVAADDVPVAIVGIVPTKVSALNGAIRVGDLLTTSSAPGYAMRCANRVKCVGAIVGKALEPLARDKGVIKVLVMLR